MKRLIPVLFVLLLLTGCKKNTVAPAANSTTEPVEVSCAYVSDSAVELKTGGAVRLYTVSGKACNIEMLGNGIVLADESGKMVSMSKEDGVLQATSEQALTILSAHDQGVIGYIESTNTVVVFDNMLNQTAFYELEDGILGMPVAGYETNEIYYCADDHIRALNLETGLTRHVMQYVQQSQELVGCYFGGNVIGWKTGSEIVFLSSEDGQVVYQCSTLSEFKTGADAYYGIFTDGYVEQVVWGRLDGEPMQLTLSETEIVYPQLDAAMVVSVQPQESGTAFYSYDMYTGTCTSAVTIDVSGSVLDITADASYVWVLTDQALYRWEISKTPIDDQMVYAKPLITAQNPDLEGLDACALRAQQIGQPYGIEILVWDAALVNDQSYVIEAEYQIETINSMLDLLEQQLSALPAELLTATDEYCGIRICLVRSIRGYDFVQYWSDGGLCIAISPSSSVQEALLTGLGWGIDSCVIGNSRDLDYWDTLNPSGFTYDYSYVANEQRTDLQYLEGNNRAFADQRSMSFPTEDRARIFYYSMLEGNEEVFSSPIMQNKLRTFCEGIREAYGLQKESQTYPWEQYLEESLAYKK